MWGWYTRPNIGRRTKWTQISPHEKKKLCLISTNAKSSSVVRSDYMSSFTTLPCPQRYSGLLSWALSLKEGNETLPCSVASQVARQG
jgi:hypothetical protein